MVVQCGMCYYQSLCSFFSDLHLSTTMLYATGSELSSKAPFVQLSYAVAPFNALSFVIEEFDFMIFVQTYLY